MFSNKKTEELLQAVHDLTCVIDVLKINQLALLAKVDAIGEQAKQHQVGNDLTTGHIESVAVRTETRLCKLMEHLEVPKDSITKPLMGRRIK